jgi:DNA mismatch endonuclease, patch repair protein
MDNLTSDIRHLNMSHIRSTDSSSELAIRSALHRLGFRFRKNDRRLTGTPDIVFPRYYAVVFVNGCFWHAHQHCSKFRLPKTNTAFWQHKLERNRERDKEDIRKLMNEGWRVGIVWECSITGKNRKQKIQTVSDEVSLWLEEGYDELYREF